MYTLFFGFKEKPFQLVPNPTFLFLSRGHEEAMAHLHYAIANGDGFVAITGEVGTGKTTLCRAFLDRLDETTEAAYIFNPRLDATQLLKAVNEEFGLPADSDSNKELIDTLNRFLLARKREGQQVLLLIDEAQNLTPEVLEQLRLLSNLETSSDKLIQMILVGQPELDELLASHQLRQLAQRITLRCRLTPLTRRETGDYIRHRLRVVAQGQGPVFTSGAIRTVQIYSHGIPRLINIVCDRALLAAFTLERYKITASLVRQAVKELGATIPQKPLPHAVALRVLIPAALGTILILLLYPSMPHHRSLPPEQPVLSKEATGSVSPLASDHSVEAQNEEGPPTATGQREEGNTLSTESPSEESPALLPAPLAPPSLASRLYAMDNLNSRQTAIQQVLDIWDIKTGGNIDPELLPDDSTFFRLIAGREAMQVYHASGNVAWLARLDLPAILVLHPPGEPAPRYLTLCAMKEDGMLFLDKDSSFLVRDEVLAPFWQGEVYIPWKDFRTLSGIIPLHTSDDAILSLKLLLADLGNYDLTPGPAYDAVTRQAIIDLQARHGIVTDGIVGPATKIVLYNEDEGTNVPHLSAPTANACLQSDTGGLE